MDDHTSNQWIFMNMFNCLREEVSNVVADCTVVVPTCSASHSQSVVIDRVV